MLVALLAWFSVPTFRSLHAVWLEDYNYTHGYLVVLASVFLVVSELRREPLSQLSPSWVGAACLAALAFVTTAAHAASTVAIAQLALPLLVISLVWAFAGAKTARRLALPVAFLYFAIPVWDLATEPLRSITIAIISTVIRSLDVPAFIDGNLIHLPSGTFEVAGGCAGLRYAIVAGTLGALVGLRHHRHWRPVLVLTLCALALAFVGNWVRVLTLVLVGHYSEMQNYLIVEDHSFFGWVVFIVSMTPLFYLHPVVPSTATDSASQAEGVERFPGGPPSSQRAVVYFACVALVIGVFLNYRIEYGSPASNVVLAAPEIPGWNIGAEWADARRPEFIGATSQFARWYEHGTERVGAYIAHYATQTQGREIVFSQHRPQGQGAVEGRRRIAIQPSSGNSLTFEQLEVVDRGAQRRVVWVGLRVAGQAASGETTAKVLQIVGALRGRRDAQALVLTAECDEDCSDAAAILSGYAAIAAEPLYANTDRSAPHDLEGQKP